MPLQLPSLFCPHFPPESLILLTTSTPQIFVKLLSLGHSANLTNFLLYIKVFPKVPSLHSPLRISSSMYSYKTGDP